MTLKLPLLGNDLVRLRAFAEGDSGLIRSVSSDPLIPLITTVPKDDSEASALAFIQRQNDRLETDAGYSFAITDASTDEAVGQIGLWPRAVDPERASLGYWLGAPFRSRGFATAALALVTDWAFDNGLQRLELAVEPWNEGSWRLAERAGFRREGLMRSWQPVGDERRDMYLYARLSADRAEPPRPDPS